jgi:hypothetical protein
MARFLLALQSTQSLSPAELLEALTPLLQAIGAEVDHRTPAHLSALVNAGQDPQRMQLFADVQAAAAGSVLELTLLSREAMGKGAPETRAVFEQMLLQAQRLPGFAVGFRSDRDGSRPR